MAGRGAGARSGDWELYVAESANIGDDRLFLRSYVPSRRGGTSEPRRTSCDRKTYSSPHGHER